MIKNKKQLQSSLTKIYSEIEKLLETDYILDYKNDQEYVEEVRDVDVTFLNILEDLEEVYNKIVPNSKS